MCDENKNTLVLGKEKINVNNINDYLVDWKNSRYYCLTQAEIDAAQNPEEEQEEEEE